MDLYQIFLSHPVITTDTRDCPEGSLFFALKGETFNGNHFAMQALEKGCAYAIVDELAGGATASDERIILVPDVLQALQQLAHQHRMTLKTPIIGVTGTNGKTTTKELIHAVLSEKYNVHYTRGNFNNHIGVPKTLLQLTSQHDMAVIEMGANHPGEIKTLVDIVNPDCGIITNVGRAHLGGFGSFEGVKATKGELYDYLDTADASRTVFINADSPDLMEMAAQRRLHLVEYSASDRKPQAANPRPIVTGHVIECKPTLTFEWNGHRVESQLIGDYNIYNMLAAATIGLTFGVSPEQITHALQTYTPSNNRSQLTITPHNHLVVDAYNANPTSMAAALTNFQNMQVEHKMVILGSMGELGDVSREEHQKVISQLQQMDLEEVWLVGEGFAIEQHPFRQFKNVDEVKAAIATSMPTDRYILIKGSNSQRLFLLPEEL